MKIELNVIGLRQTLSFETGEVTNVAVIQSDTGELIELPVSEAFAARLVTAHSKLPKALPNRPAAAPRAEVDGASRDALSDTIEVIVHRIEADADYEVTDEEIELFGLAGLDLAELISTGRIVPGRSQNEEREFSMPAESAQGEPPPMGSLQGSDNETPAEEEDETRRLAANLRNKARRKPAPPRTVPHDEAGNPVVPQVTSTRAKGGGRDDDLFGQG